MINTVETEHFVIITTLFINADETKHWIQTVRCLTVWCAAFQPCFCLFLVLEYHPRFAYIGVLKSISVCVYFMFMSINQFWSTIPDFSIYLFGILKCIPGFVNCYLASVSQYVKEEDLEGIGMTKPEMRRLKKFYKKEHPQGTFGKLKKVRSVLFI